MEKEIYNVIDLLEQYDISSAYELLTSFFIKYKEKILNLENILNVAYSAMQKNDLILLIDILYILLEDPKIDYNKIDNINSDLTNYNRNLKAMEIKHPRLYEKLKGNECDKISLDLYNNNIRYISSISSDIDVTRMLNKLDFSINQSLYVLMGIGCGNVLREIGKNLNARSKILCIEHDITRIKEVLKLHDISTLIYEEKVEFCFKDDVSYIKQLTYKYATEHGTMSNIQPVMYTIYDVDYIRKSKEIITSMFEERELLEFKLGNNIDDTLVGLDNYLHNIHELISSVGIKNILTDLRNEYDKKPAIIVASGPSLDKNVDVLKEASGKALILSCDGSYNSLIRNDVIPDGIGSVERIKETYTAFYANRDFDPDTVLVSPSIIYPKIMDKIKTKILFTKRNEPTSNLVNKITMFDKGTVSTGPSVSHMLFGFAVECGCDPIILIGQDLAYSVDGVSHVKEAETVKEQVAVEDVEVFVENENGEKLPSTYVWEKFLKSYEEIIEHTSVTVIDSSEGGAFIKGTELMTLKKSINQYCIEELSSLKSIVNDFEEAADYKDTVYKTGHIKTSNYLKTMNLMRHQSDEALNWINKSLQIIDEGLDTQDKLDDIYECIDFTGVKLVKKLNRISDLNILFRYPLLIAYKKMSGIKHDSYNIESITLNLIILKELMLTVNKYCIKAMKVVYPYHKEFLTYSDKNCKKSSMQYVEKYIQDDMYNIPDYVR